MPWLPGDGHAEIEEPLVECGIVPLLVAALVPVHGRSQVQLFGEFDFPARANGPLLPGNDTPRLSRPYTCVGAGLTAGGIGIGGRSR